MVNKKAQGLSMNFIVITAIAALILVIVIAFTTGGLGSFLKQMGGSTQSDLQAAVSSCESACNRAKLISTASRWTTTDYCKKVFDIDANGDGEVLDTADSKEVGLHCWEGDINVQCQFAVGGVSVGVKDGECAVLTEETETGGTE